MKTIVLSLPNYSFFLPLLVKNLRKENFNIVNYDYRHGEFLAKIIHVLFGKKTSKLFINIRLYLKIRKNNPDFMITVKGENISPILLKRLKYTRTITVNWFPDPMNYWDLIKEIAPYYDYFFHFDPFVIRKLRNDNFKNVYYLPFAANDIAKKTKKKYDVSFIGTYDQHREKTLMQLIDFDLNIWGDSRWRQSRLKKFVRGDRVSSSKMHNIIRKSKININLHHITTKEGANLRTFQITGCGSFLLTDYVDDLKNLFEIKKEIVTFKDSQEMKKQTEYYLQKDMFREKIAHAGYMRFKKNHTYKIRLKQMLNIISSHRI